MPDLEQALRRHFLPLSLCFCGLQVSNRGWKRWTDAENGQHIEVLSHLPVLILPKSVIPRWEGLTYTSQRRSPRSNQKYFTSSLKNCLEFGQIRMMHRLGTPDPLRKKLTFSDLSTAFSKSFTTPFSFPTVSPLELVLGICWPANCCSTFIK